LVSEFEIDRNIIQEHLGEELEPPAAEFDPDIAIVKVVRTMDERCAILKEHPNTTFYSDINEYNGPELLNSFSEGNIAI
jgi:hypothetical protein